MTLALWKQRSDVLICLLIQTLLMVIGQSLQGLQGLQGLQLSNASKTTQAQPTGSSLNNLNSNDQRAH